MSLTEPGFRRASLRRAGAVAASGGGVTAHGELTGLGANDHPQYALAADIAADPTVIGRYEILANSQSIPIVCNGNYDEVIHVECQGKLGGGLQLRINNNATPVTYIGWYAEGGGAAAANSTQVGQFIGEGGGFEVILHAKTGIVRGGFTRSWSRRADGVGHIMVSNFGWANTTDNITLFTLWGTDVATFMPGTLAIARRRKMTL